MDVLRKYLWLVVAGLLISLSFVKNNYVVDQATAYTTEIAKDSGKVYLSLRVMNAALSLVEEIELGASGGVASGSLHPFKVLEPLDDAVERMSSAVFHVGVIAASLTVMLNALGKTSFLLFGLALGVQQVSLRLGLTNKSSPMITIIEGVRNSSAIILLALFAFFASSWLAEKWVDAKWGELEMLLTEVSEGLGEIDDLHQIQMESASAGEQDTASLQEQPEPDQQTDRAMNVLKGAKDFAVGALNKGQEMIDGAVGAATGALKSVKEQYNLAKEISSKFMERKDELIEAFAGVFALFLFKTFMLPLMIFLFLYGSLKGTFRHRP